MVFFSFLLPRAIARFIRVASRILPRIYFNGVARSRLRGFLRGHVERRVLISAARRLSFALAIYYRILLSRDRARVKLFATNRVKFVHVKDGSLVDEHLWTWKGRSTHKCA